LLNIAITFDYELFLGANNSSDSDILFEPTEEFITLLEYYKLTSTFFADICSITAHKKFQLYTYVNVFEKQLKKMLKKGHDVQLHLHPNWLLSEYKDNKWNFDTTHYTVHSFGFGSQKPLNAYNIIANGKKYLESLLQPEYSRYKCVAYRAGGYSVQPHEDLFRILHSEGILIDSSVCSNMYSSSDTISYDFRSIPKCLNWWIVPGKEFSFCGKKEDGAMFEVQIPSQRNNILKRLFNSRYNRSIRETQKRGEFISMPGAQDSQRNILKRFLEYNNTFTRLTFDSMGSDRMIPFLYEIERKHRNENAYIAIVCHPKLADKGIFSNMEAVLKVISMDSKFRFVNMRQIYDEISSLNAN